MHITLNTHYRFIGNLYLVQTQKQRCTEWRRQSNFQRECAISLYPAKTICAMWRPHGIIWFHKQDISFLHTSVIPSTLKQRNFFAVRFSFQSNIQTAHWSEATLFSAGWLGGLCLQSQEKLLENKTSLKYQTIELFWIQNLIILILRVLRKLTWSARSSGDPV